MEQLMACGAVILLQLILYLVIGNDLCRWMGWEDRGILALGVGFFGYFGLFQLFALPMICLQLPFHILVIVWGIVCVLILLKGIVFHGKELLGRMAKIGGELAVKQWYLVIAAMLLLLFFIIYQCIYYYSGFDTAFYIGTVNTTLYTDSMYLFDGETGLAEKYLDMRYAFSGFYMNTAFWCRIFGLAPVIAQKYGMGSICVLMAFVLTFLIGKELFGDDTRKAYYYVIILGILNLFFISGYSTTDFLLLRGYEAKGFCANVVIPAVFYAVLVLWKDVGQKKRWQMLFLVAFASIPVSMSSLLIVPAAIGIAVLAECLAQKEIGILWRGIVCILPNAFYLVMYFLYTKKIWLIMVK